MSVNVPQGFDVKSKEPVDIRLSLTKKQMHSISVTPAMQDLFPDSYVVTCKDNGLPYFYIKLDSIDEKRVDPIYGADLSFEGSEGDPESTGFFHSIPFTTDYNVFENKPSINGVELKGDLVSSELGLQDTLIREAPIKLTSEGNIGLLFDSETLFINGSEQLQVKWDIVQKRIDSERQWREKRDSELKNYIDSEIDSEREARLKADSELKGMIDSETLARLEADSEIMRELTSEVEARKADILKTRQYIDSEIDSEKTARLKADSEILYHIDSEVVPQLIQMMSEGLDEKQDLLTSENGEGPIKITSDGTPSGAKISLNYGSTLIVSEAVLDVNPDEKRGLSKDVVGLFAKVDTASDPDGMIKFNSEGELTTRIKLPTPALDSEGFAQAIVSAVDADGNLVYELGAACEVKDVLVNPDKTSGVYSTIVDKTDRKAYLDLSPYELDDFKIDEVETMDKISDHDHFPTEYAVRDLFNTLEAGKAIDDTTFDPTTNKGVIDVKYDGDSVSLNGSNELYAKDVNLSDYLPHAAGEEVFLTDVLPNDTSEGNQIVNHDGLWAELNKFKAGKAIDDSEFNIANGKATINVLYDDKSIKLNTDTTSALHNHLYSPDVNLTDEIGIAPSAVGKDSLYLTDLTPSDTGYRADGSINHLVNEDMLDKKVNQFKAGVAIDDVALNPANSEFTVSVLYDSETIRLKTISGKNNYLSVWDVDLVGAVAGSDISLRDIAPAAAGTRADGTINPLVDLDTLNRKISESAGTFRGEFTGDTEAEAAAKLPASAVQNDYANLLITDSEGNFEYLRYKYVIPSGSTTGAWQYEYTYQHTFTPAQWQAINSGTAPGNWQKILVEGKNINMGTDGQTINAIDHTYKAGTGISIVQDTSVTDINTPTYTITSTLTASNGIKLDGTDIQHTNSVDAETVGVGGGRKAVTIKYDAQGHISSDVVETDMYPPLTTGSAGQYYRSTGADGEWSNPARTMSEDQMEIPSSQAVIDYLEDNYFATPTSGKSPSLSAGDNIVADDLKTGQITAYDTLYECNTTAKYNSDKELIIETKSGTADPNLVYEIKLNNHMWGGTSKPTDSIGVDGDIYIVFGSEGV